MKTTNVLSGYFVEVRPSLWMRAEGYQLYFLSQDAMPNRPGTGNEEVCPSTCSVRVLM
jgi:hypothetical protein